MAELKATRVKRYQALIGAYHVELENLMRALEALEQVGLKLNYPVKQVARVHNRAERFLEQISAGTFDSKALNALAALLNEGFFKGFGPDSAFDTVKGSVVQQMAKTDKRQTALYDFVFERDRGEFDPVSREEEAAAERETTELEEEA